MTATAEPPAAPAPLAPEDQNPVPARAEGVQLLGPVHGCGYRDGAALVRRADGQMVQLGSLLYGLLETADGHHDAQQLADELSERVGRRLGRPHVVRLAEKLAEQGLLAGSEHRAPPRRNPLLALRWKVLVTNPKWTHRLTAPFTFLFRPWLMWPILAAFGVVFWFVLIHKGVASATAQAFHSPGLLLLVFGLAVVSAGFHELGHAAACRYGGATPGGMGMGLYLVWPAFYTDVTDTYRLPKRSRLRVDLAGLYFNAVVAVLTMAVWLVWRADALLLLVALQILQMVKQLSPIIRADGYHILSDATGVPDLYAHMGPTVRRLLPRHRNEPSALSGRARALVTVWVLIVVPVLLSLMLTAIVLLPRLATSAWASGRHLALGIPPQVAHGQVLDVAAAVLSLIALALPVLGSALVTQKVVRTTAGKAITWSRGHPGRRGTVVIVGMAILGGIVWAWWPSGQYQPVRANQGGTLSGVVKLVSAPAAVARPTDTGASATLTPGTHLAVSMIPVGGATRRHPALFVIETGKGHAVAIVSDSTPAVGASSATSPPGGAASTTPATAGTTTPTGTSSTTAGASGATSTTSGTTPTTSGTTATTPGATATTPGATATAPQGSAGTAPAGLAPATGGSGGKVMAASEFPFTIPKNPPGGTQAVAVNTTNGGVKYDVAYSVVTVKNGAPAEQSNSAYAFAHCQACTTVAVSFQVVLIVGQSDVVAPVNAAGALNNDCPACTTTALADQIVVTLKSAPTAKLVGELDGDLRRLDELSQLGANGTPSAIAAEVAGVQQAVEQQLSASGLLAQPLGSTTSATTTPTQTTSTTTATTATTTPAPASSTTTSPSSATASPPGASSSSPPIASGTTTTSTSAAPPTTTSSSQDQTGSTTGSSGSSGTSGASGTSGTQTGAPSG